MSEPAAKDLELVGGRLCLDFINTVGDRLLSQPEDHLTHYTDLVAWSQQAGIVHGDEARRLLAEAAARPAEAASTLQRAVTFREALYRILLAAVTGRLPSDEDLAIFNAARAQTLAHSAIRAAAGGFAWQWNIDEDQLGWMLWPIIYAAAELLLSPELKKVKQCSSPDCGWLFLDTSKNHTRRWCSMEGCGNRAKARSHYQRKRQGAQPQGCEAQPSP